MVSDSARVCFVQIDEDETTNELQAAADAESITEDTAVLMRDIGAVRWGNIVDMEVTEDTAVLMRDIGAVGWGNIVDMEETMEKISMKVEDHKGRMHLFDVTFSTSYPTSPPTISAELPSPIVVDWEQGSDLSTVLSTMKKQIVRYADYFDVMSNIDDTCWVLEPMKPTFAVSKRRIVIDKTCSVLLDINPERPLDFCQMRFTGPSDKVRELQSVMSRNMCLWPKGDVDRPIRDRLEELLEVTLPTPKLKKDKNKRARTGSVDYDDYCAEYGICNSFVDPGGEKLAPDQVCPKESSQQAFHYRTYFILILGGLALLARYSIPVSSTITG